MQENVFHLKKGIDNQTTICQYLSLDKLLKQILECEYYIKRKDGFSDCNEKLPVKEYLFYPLPAGSQPSDKSTNLIEKQMQKAIKYTELSKSFVSCWTKNNVENYLMWKSYTPHPFGVCIVSSIYNFLASFQNQAFSQYNVYCAEIEYGNYNISDEPDDMLFKKANFFRDEQEIRFLFSPKDEKIREKTNIWIPYNYETMIDEIIISPFLSDKITNFLLEILKNKFKLKAKCSKIRLRY